MKKVFLLGLVMVTTASFWTRTAEADDDTLDAATVERLKKLDDPKNPDTIDVSRYPKEQQANYEVFKEKCSKCHTLARPINSELALPKEWKAYVTKMRGKKRSGIDEDSGKQIVDFLTYDSSIRKKDIIEKKLKTKVSSDATAPKDAGKAGENTDVPKN